MVYFSSVHHLSSFGNTFSDSGLSSMPFIWPKFRYVSTLKEIEDNDFNLNIPRYVDTFEAVEVVDISQLVSQLENEIEKLETELTEVRIKMAEYLKEMSV